MNLQVNARKQALKENEVHTPTFSAPVLSTHDSVPRLTGVISPPSPTILDHTESNLSHKWGISFTRKDEDIQKLDETDITSIIRPRAPSIDEHTRLASLVIKLCSNRNKELRRKINKGVDQSSSFSAKFNTMKRPIEERLQHQLDRYQRTLTSKKNTETDEFDTELIRNAKHVFSYTHLRDRMKVDACGCFSESGEDSLNSEF